MHIILTGATGLVGGGVLDAMLAMPDITRISILTRRPVPLLEARIQANDPVACNKDRVRVILHSDFNHYDDSLLQGALRGAAGVVWALGISQLVVSKEDYVTITKDYTLAAAKAFQRIPAADPTDATAPAPAEPFRFVYVSGEGATTRPGMMTQLFGRVKGETEVGLAEMTNKDTATTTPAAAGSRRFEAVSVRPAGVDPGGHAALLPFVPHMPSAMMRATRALLMPVVRGLYPSIHSPTGPLGVFLAEMAMGKYEGRLASSSSPQKEKVPGLEMFGASFRIVPNVAFRRLMGLDGHKE